MRPTSRARKRRTRTRSATSRCCASTRRREPSGKPKRARSAVLRFSSRDPRRRSRTRASSWSVTRSTPTTRVRDGRALDAPCGLVFRSVGYRGVALPGVPFDERAGVIPNERGRVAPGVYVAGWIKRGPTGVIGTNKKDATETVELLLEDLRDAPAQGATPRTTRRAPRRARRAPRRLSRLDVDRRARARRRRAARPAAREALHLGRAAGAPPKSYAYTRT